VPEVPPGQVLVKVVASGVCHTDLHAADGDWPVKPSLPFIPGHEGVGYGPRRRRREVPARRRPRRRALAAHQPAAIASTAWAAETLCDEQQMTGYTVNGGYAEYVLADPGYVGHLPANLDFAPAAPVLCAGVTVYKGLGSWTASRATGW
jgi:propanol-preferring alcohol dehydrogenase